MINITALLHSDALFGVPIFHENRTSKALTMSVKAKQVSLPLSRVRLIMKSSPDVANISQEALYLITLSAELFVENLGIKALRNGNDMKKVDYRDLAKIVDESPTLDFLKDIIPRKITAKEYQEILNNEEEINEDDYL